MIVKILKPSATFKGVRYNTNKVDKDKGELMKTANFGTLQALQNLRPKDYVIYLEAQSAASKRTKYPQLHAVISCKGRSHSKQELTAIAEQWLKGMGYGEQPYLLVFHKDTANNHIHIVSTRVDRDGKKINDSFEKIRAYEVLNRIVGVDEKQEIDKNIEKALSYGFSTRAQFMMLLEARGYSLKLSDGVYQISRYGKRQGTVSLEQVDAKISTFDKDIDRLAQLRAVFAKYRSQYDPAIVHVPAPLPGNRPSAPSGYTSAMAQMLSGKFGVQIIFHGKDGKPPYGYTVIDHSRKMVYKGKDLMPLAEFIRSSEDSPEISAKADRPEPTERERKSVSEEMAAYTDHAQETSEHWIPNIQIDIAHDIDDEAVHGRRRKRKSRTNTR
ncbi:MULTISPECIES: relaxase/mobilization nuclease domain-containing protein [Parapedobacter]|uniref:Relaxase/Mobilisation nuclease domain-containing protein n=1 Tax=Parapedobacter indicus TaxID=1477437 RepID=A0A1I3DT44_9SPHI|nr:MULTISPECIES: relaxase/mobilization nuclease domain-containing protein [Parapedobacter]MEC3879092.1 relaxase/mobilization nuclease domain-containing protein [Parapedobacter sp. 10938]PPL04824.1 relaxase/mobilization nuclease-like protein [Parapedobacter indicus]SFH89671.1 Relaxase/Mobilisation nuclease domain-containing protein [Parapedobacter indicus]